jgi:hydrogenase maturation protease
VTTAPWLLLAVGNPSRGDDALGPLLIERLRGDGVEAAGDVELMTDFQLQLEHVLDLDGRRAVLFVDAARPGATSGATLSRIESTGTRPSWTTHALRPQALLDVYRQVQDREPPAAWQLAIEGERFELGATLSDAAERHLRHAVGLAIDWLGTARTITAG